MAYQFIHLESYARVAGKGKAGGHSVRSIIAEASREAGNHPHVMAPKPPQIVFGSDLAAVEALAHEYAESVRDKQGRKLRKDGLVLIGGVFSREAGTADADWQDTKAKTLAFLQALWGDRLRSVVEHTDEANPHCHFYIIPEPGERFDSVHPGRRAAALAAASGSKKGEQNDAYKRAMKRFQEAYYQHVGAPLGLTKIGPARRRLTREEWRIEQENAKQISNVKNAAIEDAKRLASAETFRIKAGAKQSAEQIISDAKNAANDIKNDAKKMGEFIEKAQQKSVSELEKENALLNFKLSKLAENAAKREKNSDHDRRY